VPRVVSLLPSATEMLCAIGGRDLLIGRSHECDHPSGLNHVPVLTAQRTKPAAAPDAIDRQVREHLAEGTGLYTLNDEVLGSLHPDIILTQDVCEVCSIDLATVRRVVADLAAQGHREPKIVCLNPETVEDVLDDVIRIGRACGLKRPARDAAISLRSRLLAAQEFVNPYQQGPVVGFLEWTDPLFIAGHWTVQLIERAGGSHPLNPTSPRPGVGDAAGLQQGARVAGKSIAVPPEVFAATRPEALIICPCGVALDDARRLARDLVDAPWARNLPAVRTGRVAVVDGNQMFNRPGPRLADAFEWIVGWLQEQPSLIPTEFPWARL